MLTWKKRKDGSLIARHKAGDFTISCLKGKRGFDAVRLARSGRAIYQIDYPCEYKPLFKSDYNDPYWKEVIVQRRKEKKEAKEELKGVAKVIASGAKSQYRQLEITIPEEQLELFSEWAKVFSYYGGFINLQNFPKIKDKTLKNAYRHSRLVQSLPDACAKFHNKLAEDQKEKQRKEKIAAKKAKKENKTLSPIAQNRPQDEVIEEMHYEGPAPEERVVGEGMRVIRHNTGYDPPPFLFTKIKFSSLYKWGEKTRDWFEVRGKFCHVEYLVYCAQYSGFGFWECEKAVAMVKAIYKDEWDRHQATLKTKYDWSGKIRPQEEKGEKPKKTKKGKDKWGFRDGSEAAMINAVISKIPKSPKRIKHEARVARNVSGHLSTLVKRKLVKKVEGGKYRLRKPKNKI